MGLIYLVRHGQAAFGSADYDQLSDLGELQARQLGAWFAARKVPLHLAFSGAMKRHAQTAQAFFEGYGQSLHTEAHAGLNEYDHEAILQALIGQYDDPDVFEKQVMRSSDPRRAFQDLFEQAIARWLSGQHDYDYPETWPAFKARVMSGLGYVCAQVQVEAKTNAVVFTSGGAMTTLTQQLLHIPDQHAFALNWVITNCSFSKLIVGKQGLRLASFNEQAHFEGQIAGLIEPQAAGLEAYAHKPNGLITYR